MSATIQTSCHFTLNLKVEIRFCRNEDKGSVYTKAFSLVSSLFLIDHDPHDTHRETAVSCHFTLNLKAEIRFCRNEDKGSVYTKAFSLVSALFLIDHDAHDTHRDCYRKLSRNSPSTVK